MDISINFKLVNKGSISIQACDNCSFYKRKCDRILPKCTLCSTRQLDCTRFRVLQRKPFMGNNMNYYQQVYSSKVTSRKSNKVDKPRKVQSIDDFSLTKEISLLRIQKPKFDLSKISASRFPIHSFLLIIKSKENLKRLYELHPMAGIFYFLKSLNLTTVKPCSPKTIEVKIQDLTQFYSKIMTRATFAYFKEMNIYFPLFSIDDYFNLPRSILLKAAVSLVGISLLEQTNEVLYVGNQLKDLLMLIMIQMIKNPNLNWIQTLVVLGNGLKGHPYSPPDYLFADILKMCHCIGLHLKPCHRLPLHYKLERKLAYSAALYMDTNSNPNSIPNSYYSDIWNHTLSFHNVNNFKKIEYILLSTMGKFRYHLSYDALDIYKLVKLSEERDYCKNDVFKSTSNYLKSVKSFTLKALIALYKLKKVVNHYKSWDLLINCVVNSINLLSNSVYVTLYELRFKIESSLATNDLEEALTCIQKLFQYNRKLGPFPVSSNRIFSVYNCMRFLASHYSKNQQQIKVIIHEGLDLFHFLSKVPTYKGSVEMCIVLTRMLFKATNIPINTDLY